MIGDNTGWLNSQYQSLFGRAGDQGGLDYWNQQLSSGMSQDAVLQALRGSQEFTQRQAAQAPKQDYTSQLNDLYRNTLRREADQGGLDYWNQQLQSGKSLDDVRQAFSGSDEFKQLNQPSFNRSTAANTNPYGVQTGNAFAGSQNPYVQAAQQNALGNLAGAQAATSANRVNQSTPFGDLQYTQSGFDSSGNPIWNAKQTLSPGMQQAADNIQRTVASQTANPFDVSKTQNQMINTPSPTFQTMGDRPDLQKDVEGTGMTGWDRANELLMSRLRPQMEQRDAALNARLANQGIMPGTEAFLRAKQAGSQADNDLMVQAQLGGAQVQNQMFNQNLNAGQFRNQALGAENQMGLQNLGFNNAAAQQGFGNEIAKGSFNNAALQNNFSQNLTAYNNPLQQLNAFRQGSAPNFVQNYNQQPSAGPDYFGAFSTSMANDIAAQNLALQNEAAKRSGMVDLGVAGLIGSGGLSGITKAADWVTGKVSNWF